MAKHSFPPIRQPESNAYTTVAIGYPEPALNGQKKEGMIQVFFIHTYSSTITNPRYVSGSEKKITSCAAYLATPTGQSPLAHSLIYQVPKTLPAQSPRPILWPIMAPDGPGHWVNRIHVDDAARACAHLLAMAGPQPGRMRWRGMAAQPPPFLSLDPSVPIIPSEQSPWNLSRQPLTALGRHHCRESVYYLSRWTQNQAHLSY